MELPRLVILDLYRNALTTVERMSRTHRDKALHAWAVKAKRETSELMVQIAHDEMEEISNEEEVTQIEEGDTN